MERSCFSKVFAISAVMMTFFALFYYGFGLGLPMKLAMPTLTGASTPVPATNPGSSDPVGDEWPMFHGALDHAGVTATTPVQGTGPLWNYTTGASVSSSPAVSGGHVYVGSFNDKVYCLDATTGAHVWHYATSNVIWSSSPAVAGSLVYVGSEDNYVYCLNANTGAFGWSYHTNNQVDSSPAITGWFLYIGSRDGYVYCLDASVGTKVWNYNVSGPAVEASPAIWNGRVYVANWENYSSPQSRNNLYCLNATSGTKFWNYTTGDYMESAPAVAGGYVYVGSNDHKLYCLNANTGIKQWSFTTGGWVASSPAIAGTRVYFGSCDGYIYCLDASTGAMVWNRPTTAANAIFSSPAVAAGRVYVGTRDYKIYCLNATTGTLLWSYTTGGYVDSSPAIAGGRVYVGSGDGKVYCLPMILTASSPGNFTATAGNARVVLSWQTPSSNAGVPITGYKIYRGTSAGAETYYVTVGNVTTSNDTSVTNGQTYYYKVCAVNSGDEGAQSNEVTVTPTAGSSTPPSTPSSVSGFPFTFLVGIVAAGLTFILVRNKRKFTQ